MGELLSSSLVIVQEILRINSENKAGSLRKVPVKLWLQPWMAWYIYQVHWYRLFLLLFLSHQEKTKRKQLAI